MIETSIKSCTNLRGVGPQLAERLAKLGIHSTQDILFHLPYRYQDRTRITPIANSRAGDYAVIEGVVMSNRVQFARRRVWTCQIQDLTGRIECRFFHFNQSQRARLTIGSRVRCFGEIRLFQNRLTMVHPEYQMVGDKTPVAETLTPIYPTTEGISQQMWRKLTDQVLKLAQHGKLCEELLPPECLTQFKLMDLQQALQFIHRPPPSIELARLENGDHPAQIRLAFEELLANQCALLRVRQQIKTQSARPLLVREPQKLLDGLPFELTQAQQRTLAEISADLQSECPMLRLLQGDVGSGKTIVAAVSALQAIDSGCQVALMAPTEILAEQHYQNFSAWFDALGINTMFLSGKSTARDRREVLQFLAMGEVDCLIGTHALFQEDVIFKKLGLVIIDEQHRFGVHQRLALAHKGETHHPHQLIMTATPIPRTLAMTAYADLDISIIDELPPGRTPIKTVVMQNNKRDAVMERVCKVIESGRQVYWVCTLIEESESLQAQAAEDTATMLSEALAPVQVGLIHGRMKPAQKEQLMAQFKAGRLDLLVATTVIEVGVDVPNASLMVIENAERLGLAQLHQLRGRVGRGQYESYCVLLYQPPLTEIGQARLEIMRETNDGFKIANKDLELRGPGEVLGTRQTGLARLRIANLLRDRELLPAVKQAATMLIELFPARVQPLIARWLGDNEKYSRV